MNKIIKQIYLANVYEAIKYGSRFDCIINVMNYNEMTKFEQEDYSTNKTSVLIHIPVLQDLQMFGDVRVEPLAMNLVAHILEFNFRQNIATCIHCAAAEERSPLAIIWWLHQYNILNNNSSLEDCYEFVKSKHPQTANRLEWLKRLVPHISAFGDVE